MRFLRDKVLDSGSKAALKGVRHFSPRLSVGEQGQRTLLQSLLINRQIQLHRVHIPVAEKLLDQFKGYLILEQSCPQMSGEARERHDVSPEFLPASCAWKQPRWQNARQAGGSLPYGTGRYSEARNPGGH